MLSEESDYFLGMKSKPATKSAKQSATKSTITNVELDFPEPINEVHLIGRISSEPIAKVLPSGDQVVEFRIVVGRTSRGESSSLSKGKAPQIDTLDIAAWSPKVRRLALAVKANTWVEVHGAVRRRFWQAPTGLASRWQVEASDIKRIKANL
jgi:single-stranded DNA-binding protein